MSRPSPNTSCHRKRFYCFAAWQIWLHDFASQFIIRAFWGINAAWSQLVTFFLHAILPQSASTHLWRQSFDVQLVESQVRFEHTWSQYADAWQSNVLHRFPVVRLADGIGEQSWLQETWGVFLPHENAHGRWEHDMRFCLHWSFNEEGQFVMLVAESTAPKNITNATVNRTNAICNQDDET